MLSLGGYPILERILNRPSLLTWAKAFVRSMKATKSLLLGLSKLHCNRTMLFGKNLRIKITMHCTTEKISRSEIDREVLGPVQTSNFTCAEPNC